MNDHVDRAGEISTVTRISVFATTTVCFIVFERTDSLRSMAEAVIVYGLVYDRMRTCFLIYLQSLQSYQRLDLNYCFGQYLPIVCQPLVL